MNNEIVLCLARKNAILFHSLNELLHDLGASCTDAIIFHSLNELRLDMGASCTNRI